MSDVENASRSLSPEYAPTKKAVTTRKRKSDAAGPSSSKKKARTSKAADDTAAGRDLVAEVLASPDEYASEALGDKILLLARYARSLEGPKAKKSENDIAATADKILKAAQSGIKKQMKWRATCKTGGAKWVYDGYCPDPEVFGRVLGLNGPPSFKMKKFTREEFQKYFGYIEAHAMYNELRITSDVNVRYNSETGEFKLSGSYGI